MHAALRAPLPAPPLPPPSPDPPHPATACPAPQVPVAGGGALRLAGCSWEAGSGHLVVHGLVAGHVLQLEALAAALLPPGAPLRSLALQFCQLDLPAPQSTSPSRQHARLAGLTALQLDCCGIEPGGRGSTDRALAALLAACGLGLQRLSVRHCRLSELPVAPCLAGQKRFPGKWERVIG